MHATEVFERWRRAGTCDEFHSNRQHWTSTRCAKAQCVSHLVSSAGRSAKCHRGPWIRSKHDLLVTVGTFSCTRTNRPGAWSLEEAARRKRRAIAWFFADVGNILEKERPQCSIRRAQARSVHWAETDSARWRCRYAIHDTNLRLKNYFNH